MRKVSIEGVARVDACRNKERDWAMVEINGMGIQNLLADKLLLVEADARKDEASLCRVVIRIDPYEEKLVVNGEEMKLEL